jgi:hypothetical protein
MLGNGNTMVDRRTDSALRELVGRVTKRCSEKNIIITSGDKC